MVFLGAAPFASFASTFLRGRQLSAMVAAACPDYDVRFTEDERNVRDAVVVLTKGAQPLVFEQPGAPERCQLIASARCNRFARLEDRSRIEQSERIECHGSDIARGTLCCGRQGDGCDGRCCDTCAQEAPASKSHGSTPRILQGMECGLCDELDGSAASYDDTRLERQVSTRVLQHETRAGVGSQAQDAARKHVTSNVPEVSTCTVAAFASMAQQLPLVTVENDDHFATTEAPAS